MARFTVDTSRTQPKSQGINVPQHPSIMNMPLAPGSQVGPETLNPPSPSTLTVRNVPPDTLPSMPVPPASISAPPKRVVAEGDHPPTLA